MENEYRIPSDFRILRVVWVVPVIPLKHVTQWLDRKDLKVRLLRSQVMNFCRDLGSVHKFGTLGLLQERDIHPRRIPHRWYEKL